MAATDSSIITRAIIGASYWRSTTQSFASGAVIFNADTQLYDTHSFVTTGASWKCTIPAGLDGRYLVIASVNMTMTGAVSGDFYKNGSRFTHGTREQASGNQSVYGNDVLDLVAGDYFDFRVDQSVGTISSQVVAGVQENYIRILYQGK